MESTPNPRHPSGFPLAASVAAPATTNRLDSQDLLRGAREIVICHGDQEYRLRHTQNDKLILTK